LTEHTAYKRNKLSYEILGLFSVAFAISLFLFAFLSLSSTSLAVAYCSRYDLILTEIQNSRLEIWIYTVCFTASVLFFIVFFLFLMGQKFSYIHVLTKGVEALKTHRMDYTIPLEGNNELTQLGQTINYLCTTEKQLLEKERALNEDKEQFIRSLSHDIRTPLTSILAYSDYLIGQDSLTLVQQQEYLILIHKKAEQIREMANVLLDGGQRNPEYFENAGLLMQQLAEEFEETLEDVYPVSINLSGCPAFSGTFDVGELRRIIDNLISNVQRSADPHFPVTLTIRLEEQGLLLSQENRIRSLESSPESYRMGIAGIRRITHHYDGRIEVHNDENQFRITILLSKF